MVRRMPIDLRRAVLVTGSRNWDDPIFIRETLAETMKGTAVFLVIEGGASGADTTAGSWAWTTCDHERFSADWDRHGKAAGPIRNTAMRERLLDLQGQGYDVMVLAFKEGFDFRMRKGGTENMVRQAQRVGIRCTVFGRRVTGANERERRVLAPAEV